MSAEIKPGLKGEARIKVDENSTAITYESGSVRVFATPAMVRLMEKAALSSVDPLLEPGLTTVGTKVEVKHLSATPVGMEVVVTSRLVEADGKRLLFEVEARDEAELIGSGLHERFIVKKESFLKRTEGKLTSR
ncbi:thioesterase family protein [Pelotomaculum propionicicum]|uniref:Fluoroacetyl-CoA thioesterase n=1 Tax=Pelotomaculum propionicicum TaxID=258475 RepID=A0A4Y7RJ02_9FIRM|nr:thioesterase family protein [Pelotomaculum propionicicum]NLI11663.1 thioesterase family protein [Peptococcaceae bacterium]TEB08974.1 Fluoroacetyl-CoA thioesterase [Pelotomaculum propionicicum]